jgi:uncharacterized protein with HEPN domain
MPSKSPAQRLQDIIDNIDAINVFTQGLTFEGFMGDRKTTYAVTRALEIVPEASRRLPEDLKQRHADIDWLAVAAAGNVYRHEYDSVDEQLIWHTVRGGLGRLREVSLMELDRLKPITQD